MNFTAVLLPGLDGTGVQFAPLVRALGENLRTLVVSYPDRHATYQDHVTTVVKALPKGSPYLLIAESYSGPVAIEVAARRPEDLKGMVLCATFHKCPYPLLTQLRSLLQVLPPWRVPASLLAPLLLGVHRTPELIALLDEALSRVKPWVLRERLDNVAGVDTSSVTRSVTVPTLYLRAKADRIVPRQAGDALAASIPGAIIRELEGPHFLLQASPELVAKEIRHCALAS